MAQPGTAKHPVIVPVVHLSLPLLFVFLFTLINARDNHLNASLVFIVGGCLFSLPHILWTIVLKYAKPSPLIQHTGYLSASLALVVIACLPPDTRGFLNQWLNYWRLASLLMIIGTGAAFAIRMR